MHVRKFLHKLLANVTHKKRIISLILLVEAVLVSKQLSVTRLGRALNLRIKERSGIRRADRLIGNKKLHREKKKIYEMIINLLINKKIRPIIIVDWSSIPSGKYNNLRAALVTKGRTLTIYEEVHPVKTLGNRRVQNNFLKTLKELLPNGCKPIIVTDAGFHNNWFKEIIRLGWDYVGRIRNGKIYRLIGNDEWKKVDDLCKTYHGGSRSFGKIEISRKNSLLSYLYVTREVAKRRLRSKNELKKGDRSVRNHRIAAKEAWVLVSSLFGYAADKKVVKIYRSRMQIEESFRDLKSSRYGFSFEHSYSKHIARIEILLLIAMLASIIAWLIGLAAERMNLQYNFQANSVKTRRVLSLFFLGCQVIRRKIKIPIEVIKDCIKEINYVAI